MDHGLERVMTEQGALVVFDGATLWMFAGFARWRATQAARRAGRELIVEQMLFDAGRGMFSGDLLAGFWRAEAVGLDWLEDFLCDPATGQMMARLLAPPQDEAFEEEEMLFTKSQLVTTGMEMSEYS
jgi:hypothetical protein